MNKRFFLGCLIAVTGITGAWAQTTQIGRFEEDGIAYNITDAEALTVEVTELVEAGPDVTGYTGDITIPSTVTHGDMTYRVTKIGDYAFADNSGYNVNSPTSITIPEGVTVIGKGAFYSCRELTTVTLPVSVDSIAEYAFFDCTAMTAVYYDGTTEQWLGMDFTTSTANPVSAGHNLYVKGELLTDLVIPETVTEINSCSFYNCTGLKSLELHDGVATINSNAFDGCSNLASVKLGSGLETIGQSAFNGCTGLTEVTIPDGVTEIEWWVFGAAPAWSRWLSATE